jgi:hypothetical protein
MFGIFPRLAAKPVGTASYKTEYDLFFELSLVLLCQYAAVKPMCWLYVSFDISVKLIC